LCRFDVVELATHIVLSFLSYGTTNFLTQYATVLLIVLGVMIGVHLILVVDIPSVVYARIDRHGTMMYIAFSLMCLIVTNGFNTLLGGQRKHAQWDGRQSS